MKIKFFAATHREQAAVPFGGDLLCQTLRSPVEPSFATAIPELARSWQQCRSQWGEQHLKDAVSGLMRFSQTPGLASRSKIPTLFLAAHLHFHCDDVTQANRCIQSAVRMYADETGLATNSVPELSASCAAGTCDWLILAISSLIKSDMESCLLWIHQAERDLHRHHTDKESSQHLQLQGDLHAVLACVAAKSKETSEAEKALAIAYRSHIKAESFRSASRDLLLTARLALLQNQRSRALSLLDAAECQLLLALSPHEFDRCPLVAIIQTERNRLKPTDRRAAAARWN